jgi:uroporphyrin-III C-methyltransferase / precorrin-2 dehydrogenase / sirohydrochlorin ferrochelatase
MSVLPLMFDLKRGPVVLTGAGAPALAKLALLRSRGADILWYPLAELGGDMPGQGGTVEIRPGEPKTSELEGAIALVLASGSAHDERLSAFAQKRGIPVNVVDKPERSTFYFPAIADRGEVVVAIGTGGASPVLARRLREQIEAILPQRAGELAAFIGRWRHRLRVRFGTVGGREFWEGFVDGPLGAGVLEGRPEEAEAFLAGLDDREAIAPKAPIGRVTLVGAGPGDPDLLTLKALHALQNADAVFYDELVTPEILGRARREAVLIPSGRRKDKPGPGQDMIHRQMIEAARAGKQVVRLKGGDPFVFGRGGEEVEAMRAAGVPVSVIPGITAAMGAAAEWQIPLTYRNESDGIAFVTAHRAAGAEDEDGATDWSRFTDPQTTVAIYMGLGQADAIRDSLIAAGRNPATPVAVIDRATREGSQALCGSLAELAVLAGKAQGPALLILGEAVKRSKAWQKLRERAKELAPE